MSDSVTNRFELPDNIERYLAILSKLCASLGNIQLQEIIVNSEIRVLEDCDSGYWSDGTVGHALYFILPELLYLNIAKQKSKIEKQICSGINDAHNVQGEFIASVFLEMEVINEHDWRKESGLLLTGKRVVPQEATNRIWGQDGYRVFLSHKVNVKEETAELKEKLAFFGVSCFVAHEDIVPTKEWLGEIENALFSMNAFVAFMTEGFHDSDWTDQEVGVAIGRGVPIISIRAGQDPYGFIGKFQALTCSWVDTPEEIVKILVKQERMLNAYINAVEKCNSFDKGNYLSVILPSIDRLSDKQANNLINAFNENSELRGSFGFNGAKPRSYGYGLVSHLNRLTGRTYRRLGTGPIEGPIELVD